MPSSTDVALSRLFAEGRARAAATDPEHAELWEALADASEGGKRFRPALVTATHDALGGNLSAAVVQVGAAVELLHTAFVIHDDVIDRGDYSGPGGARAVLRDTRVDVAILETARGGLLRRGLGVERADAALITNIAEDGDKEQSADKHSINVPMRRCEVPVIYAGDNQHGYNSNNSPTYLSGR